MKIYKYSIEFMEEVYFSSQEIDRLFMTKPIIGNYALAYALGWCNAKYNQTNITYKEDFVKVNEMGLYITPASVKNPKYNIFSFNGLSDTYNHKMDQAKHNYPQVGKIKALSIGNEAEGFIFCKAEFNKLRYIRLGKFMGKVKLNYEECKYKVIEDEFECNTLVNAVDLHPNLTIKDFEMVNVYPVPLYKKLKGQGKVYQISSPDGMVSYPNNLSLGGIL